MLHTPSKTTLFQFQHVSILPSIETIVFVDRHCLLYLDIAMYILNPCTYNTIICKCNYTEHYSTHYTNERKRIGKFRLSFTRNNSLCCFYLSLFILALLFNFTSISHNGWSSIGVDKYVYIPYRTTDQLRQWVWPLEYGNWWVCVCVCVFAKKERERVFILEWVWLRCSAACYPIFFYNVIHSITKQSIACH